MRAVVQRVSRARVVVAGETVGDIGRGLLVLLGVAPTDTREQVSWMAEKIAGMRIFRDAEEKMNLSVQDVGGAVLVVSQFTLLADCRGGRRPSFTEAADPALAERLYGRFNDRVAAAGLAVATGVFRAHMNVALVNDGPVTVMIETPARSEAGA